MLIRQYKTPYHRGILLTFVKFFAGSFGGRFENLVESMRGIVGLRYGRKTCIWDTDILWFYVRTKNIEVQLGPPPDSRHP